MRIIKLFLASILLFACQKYEPNTLNIGTIAGPETALVEAARSIAFEKYGLTLKIIEFNDYNLPNQALEDGSLDANVYQHLPYLKTAIKNHGYNLEVIAKTFIYPTGLYSNKYKTLKALPEQALIAIPNDPSNEARALYLLQQAGLIQLKEQQDNPEIKDIVNNPRHLRFKALDAAQLPRIIPDVDAAVINTNYAVAAGLSPMKDALFLESKKSPYANIVVINKNTKKKKQLQDFVKAMQSDTVKAKAKELFGEAAQPAY